ncbi:MAG: SLC13 family permease [Phycisphaerales bacterium]
MHAHSEPHPDPWTPARLIGLFLGPVVAALLYFILPTQLHNAAGEVTATLTNSGRLTIAIGGWLAVWWVSEAIPIEAAALLPLVAFPLFGVATFKETAIPYADEVVYLFLGGMLLGCAMERWNLHRRLALLVMLKVGTSPPKLLAGILLATALLSMWVSNTAAAIMMLPIAAGVVRIAQHSSRNKSPATTSASENLTSLTPDLSESSSEGPGRPAKNFGVAAMLAVAYGASIGGVGTLVGTPPNGVCAAFIAKTYPDTLTFSEWIKLGVPVMLVTLPVCWGLLLLLFPTRNLDIHGATDLLKREHESLGKTTKGEWLVIIIFSLASLAWIFRPQLVELFNLTKQTADGKQIALLTDAGIAITASLLMFLIPVKPRKGVMLLDWRTARTIPWGVLLLFGGGLTLAAAVEANGVDKVVASLFAGLHGIHPLIVVLIVTAAAMFISEIGSNTAVATVLLPIVATAAPAIGIHPYMLIFAVTLAVSLAFMMPSGTPPNALVFSSGYLRVPQMVRAGFLLNLACVLIITTACYFVVRWMGMLPTLS